MSSALGHQEIAHVLVEPATQDPTRRLRCKCLRPVLDGTSKARENGELYDLTWMAGTTDLQVKAKPPPEVKMPSTAASDRTAPSHLHDANLSDDTMPAKSNPKN